MHYGSLACDMDRVIADARSHNLSIVEDTAHALPASWRGNLIGTLESDMTIFSFYANKTITTGEGGMIVTRDTTHAKRMRVMPAPPMQGLLVVALEKRYRAQKRVPPTYSSANAQ